VLIRLDKNTILLGIASKGSRLLLRFSAEAASFEVIKKVDSLAG
jgi:hypothetical protein